MFARSSKFYWKKQLMVLLAFIVVASGFSNVFAPQTVNAEEIVPAPGGVNNGLISWVDMGKSVSDEEKNANSVRDLSDLKYNRQWSNKGTI